MTCWERWKNTQLCTSVGMLWRLHCFVTLFYYCIVAYSGLDQEPLEKLSKKPQANIKIRKKKKRNCWASHHSESFAVNDAPSLSPSSLVRIQSLFGQLGCRAESPTDRQPRHRDVFTICSGRTDVGTSGEDETSSWHTRGERRGRGRDLLPDISRYSAESSGSNPWLSLEDWGWRLSPLILSLY